MKKTTLFVWMLLAPALTLFGQEVGPKKFLVGGGLSLSSVNNSYSNATGGVPSISSEISQLNFSISPYAGKYVNEKWILGLGFEIGWQHQKTAASFSGNKTIINTTSISPGFFARYLLNSNDKLVFQLSPSVGFSYDQITRDDGNESKSRIFAGDISIGPLLSYALSNKVNLIGRFGSLSFFAGTSKAEESDNKTNFSSFNLNLSLRSIGLGLEITL